MKRFTLFLALCLTMIGTALAALPTITDISQIDENKKYIISSASRGGWAASADKTKFYSTKEAELGTTVPYNNTQCQVQFKTIGGNIYLYSVSAGKYVDYNSTSGNTHGVLTTAASHPITLVKQNDNTFVFKFDESHYFNLNGENELRINDWKTADVGNKMTITEVPDVVVTVTWEYYLEGDKLYKTVQDIYAGNTDCTAPAVDFFVFDSPREYNTGSEATKTIKVYGHPADLPFEVTTDLQNPKWYAVSLHTNQNFFLWHYDGNDALVSTPVPNKKAADYNVLSDDAYWWCFTGNLIDGFKIYNKKAGTNYTLNSTADQAQVGTATNNNDLWTLVESTSSIANSACFQIKNGSNYINHQGGLKYYGSTDEGSSALFYTPASFPVNYINSYANIPEGAIGSSNYLVGENKTNALAQVVAAETDALNFAPANALAATCQDLAEGGFVEMTPGYYRVYSALPGLFARSKGLYLGDNNSVRWGDVTASNAGNIFKFEETATTGKYNVYVCNAKQYLQNFNGETI